MFENINNLGNSLNYFVGNSPEEILEQVKQIKLPMQVISMYSVGAKHYIWFVTTAKIIKTTTNKGK
jgi:hypothetical protein